MYILVPHHPGHIWLPCIAPDTFWSLPTLDTCIIPHSPHGHMPCPTSPQKALWMAVGPALCPAEATTRILAGPIPHQALCPWLPLGSGTLQDRDSPCPSFPSAYVPGDAFLSVLQVLINFHSLCPHTVLVMGDVLGCLSMGTCHIGATRSTRQGHSSKT